jgi:hypothetical protein
MSVKKLENLFGLSRELTLLILGASILLTISMVYKIMAPPPMQHWQIIQNGEYYLTADPVENGSCVDFTDEDGQARTICGSYKLKRI